MVIVLIAQDGITNDLLLIMFMKLIPFRNKSRLFMLEDSLDSKSVPFNRVEIYDAR